MRETQGERERDPGERVREGTGERGREVQGRETEKGVAPPSCSRTGGFGPLAGTAAGRRRSAGGAVAQGWPLATPQKNTGGAAAPPPTEKERGGCCPPQPTHRGPRRAPWPSPGRRHSAGGAPDWGGAGHPKKRRGLCPLNKDAQGAGRPPGRAQGRRQGAGGGLPPPEVPKEGGGRR